MVFIYLLYGDVGNVNIYYFRKLYFFLIFGEYIIIFENYLCNIFLFFVICFICFVMCLYRLIRFRNRK